MHSESCCRIREACERVTGIDSHTIDGVDPNVTGLLAPPRWRRAASTSPNTPTCIGATDRVSTPAPLTCIAGMPQTCIAVDAIDPRRGDAAWHTTRRLAMIPP